MQIEPDVSKAQQIRPSVLAVILNERRELLLQRRSDNGQWGLPGGSVEIGESVTEAIQREVEEETGLRVEVVRLVGTPMGRLSTSSTPALSVGLWVAGYGPVQKPWSWPTSSLRPCLKCWCPCTGSGSAMPSGGSLWRQSGRVAAVVPVFMGIHEARVTQ